jgi:hypothetical protein
MNLLKRIFSKRKIKEDAEELSVIKAKRIEDEIFFARMVREEVCSQLQKGELAYHDALQELEDLILNYKHISIETTEQIYALGVICHMLLCTTRCEDTKTAITNWRKLAEYAMLVGSRLKQEKDS